MTKYVKESPIQADIKFPQIEDETLKEVVRVIEDWAKNVYLVLTNAEEVTIPAEEFTSLVLDLTPQLGGNLDANGNNIAGVTPTEMGYLSGITSSVQDQIDNAFPIGGMCIWTTGTAPDGFLLCYGQAVSRTTYSDLFDVIGTTYGTGDGSTTFNLPDMRGRVPVGKDNMGGSSADRVTHANADTIGSSEGAEKHQLTEAELAAHTHGIGYTVNPAASGGGEHAINGGSTVQSQSTGGDTAHNNMQPYLTLNYIIKN